MDSGTKYKMKETKLRISTNPCQVSSDYNNEMDKKKGRILHNLNEKRKAKDGMDLKRQVLFQSESSCSKQSANGALC